jgi:hypothetical protein
MKEMWGFFEAPAKPALPTKPDPARDDYLIGKPAPFLRTEKQVGRNDPAPAGAERSSRSAA